MYRITLCLAAAASVVFLPLASGTRRAEVNGTLDWWQTTVVYEVYPRSYQDTNDDGIGDLKGIESRLDYIQSLGVGTIWLCPIYDSPMKDFGYDVSNYTSVDPIFGTMEDFDSLMAAVKARGLRLVLDYVPNHTSNEHPWFNASRLSEGQYKDYYVWMNGTGANGTDPPNNWLEMFGGSAWEFDDVRGQFYLHQFILEQPDLNYREPLVHQELISNWQFWLDKGIDGFRCDAIIEIYEDARMLDEPRSYEPGATPFDWAYLDHIYTNCQEQELPLLLEWRDVLDSYTAVDGEHRLMMTEGYCSPEQAMTYYGNATQELADFPFNFELQQINITNCSAIDIYNFIDNWLSVLPDYAWPNFLVGNHDQRRIASRMGPANVDGMNMMVLLLGGTAVIYNGEELGMENNMNISWEESQDPYGCNYGQEDYLEHSRDPERTPMQWDDSPGAGFTANNVTPWLPINANSVYLNLKAQESEGRSHVNIFRQLVALRNESSFTHGSIDFPLVTEEVLSFLRLKRGSAGFAVLINIASRSVVVDLTSSECCPDYRLPDSGQVRLASGTSPRDPGDSVDLTDIPLGPNEAIVVEFQPILI